jgi:hypothetical protein
MKQKPPKTPPRKEPEGREERLRQALKANLARRKAQARGRDASGAGRSGKEGQD